jgi:adenylate cyclase class IV
MMIILLIHLVILFDTDIIITIKRKINECDNMERIEVNMPIVPQDFNTVEAFSNLLGYKHDFRIYKVCNIYWIDRVVFSYYLVFDEN